VGGMRSARINVAVQEKRRHPEMERVTISVLAAVEGAPCMGVAVSSEARVGGGLATPPFSIDSLKDRVAGVCTTPTY
jgi:hypothetical protein